MDFDATIVLAHSEKEKAAPTWKKTYGFHPLAAFADHGAGASGEPLAILLHSGNAGSNTASEHIEVTKLALAQLPRKLRRRLLIRTDSGGGTHEFLNWLASPSRRLHYSAGITITEDMQEAILAPPRPGLGTGLRRGWAGAAGCLGGRADRPAGPGRLAGGDAGDRTQGAPAPRRAAAVH